MLLLGFAGFISNDANAASFNDLNKTPWAEKEILYLSDKKIINGYGNGVFGPTDKITREQAALMLMNALYPNQIATVDPRFTDVNPSSIYYNAIALASEKGVVNGYADKSFKGGSSITRAETVAMIDKAYTINRATAVVSFADVKSGEWYTMNLLDLATNNIISGYTDGSFKPQNAVTRAEFSVILTKAMEPAYRLTAAQKFIKEVIDLTNVQRKKNGLSALQEDINLSKVAQLKSADMMKNNYFEHNSPTYGSPFDMMDRYNITYRAAGENIAYGQTTPAIVVGAWMDSPGHRKNILNDSFTHIGIGYEEQGRYWTQMFIGK